MLERTQCLCSSHCAVRFTVSENLVGLHVFELTDIGTRTPGNHLVLVWCHAVATTNVNMLS